MSIPDPIVLLDARARYVHPAFQMSRASTKTVFDATGKLVTVPANALGWERSWYMDGGISGFLSESTVTNQIVYSNDLSQTSVWVRQNVSVTPDAIVGPDGNGMAKVVENTEDGFHTIGQDVTFGEEGQVYAYSCIIKTAERKGVRLQARDGATAESIRVDWRDGEITSTFEASNSRLIRYGTQEIGDGFYRLWMVGFFGEGVTTVRLTAQMQNDITFSYEGDGTSGIYIGCFQAEPSYAPTSYIETSSAAGTRLGDFLEMTSPEDHPWFASDRGTILVDMNQIEDPGLNTRLAVSMTGLCTLYLHSNGILYVGSSLGPNINISTTFTPRRKVALTWDSSELGVVHNGTVSPISREMAAFSVSGIRIGGDISGNAGWGAPIHRVVYYSARLSNADLQSLTAIQE